MNMNDKLEEKFLISQQFTLPLQEKFPFMKRDMSMVKDSSAIRNQYQAWGCECSKGWFQVIYDLCQAITDIYAKYEAPVDIVVKQVKEKFGSLRFYYGFEDTPAGLQAIDFLGGSSLRFEPTNENDDEKRKMRHEIAAAVRKYEEMSKITCENCGKEGRIRMDLRWKRTLCDECYNCQLRLIEERKKSKKLTIEDILDKE